jgi:hypothetical protein
LTIDYRADYIETRWKQQKSSNGPLTIDYRGTMSKEEAQKQPCYVARGRLTTPSNLCYCFYDAVWLHIVPLYTIPGIKRASLHLSNGFYMGYQTGQLIGLKSAVAHVASNLNQQVRQQYQAIQRQSLTQEERNDQVERILGSVPDGQSMAGLASGFARLSGLYTTIETGRENSTFIRQFPQPRVLQTPMYQNLAILCAIQLPSEDIVRIFGKDFKSSEASIAASHIARKFWSTKPQIRRSGSFP